MPYGILGLLAGAMTGHWLLGLSLFVAAILNRMIESWTIGWGVVRDPVAFKRAWLYPLRDLLGFACLVRQLSQQTRSLAGQTLSIGQRRSHCASRDFGKRLDS